MSWRDAFEGITFRVAAGEIYGLAGLTDSGRTRIVSSIFGLEPPDSGLVRAPHAARDYRLASCSI